MHILKQTERKNLSFLIHNTLKLIRNSKDTLFFIESYPSSFQLYPKKNSTVKLKYSLDSGKRLKKRLRNHHADQIFFCEGFINWVRLLFTYLIFLKLAAGAKNYIFGVLIKDEQFEIKPNPDSFEIYSGVNESLMQWDKEDLIPLNHLKCSKLIFLD